MPANPLTQAAPLTSGMTTYVNKTVTITGSVSQILLNDPTALSLLLVNISGDSIFVGNNAQVSLNQGIELVPAGGYMKLARWEDYDYVGAPFWAISSGVSSPLQIVKVTSVNTLL